MHKVLYFSSWKQSCTKSCISHSENGQSHIQSSAAVILKMVHHAWASASTDVWVWRRKKKMWSQRERLKARWWQQPRLLSESHSAQAPTRIRTFPWCRSEFPDWCRLGWSNQKTLSPGIRTQNKHMIKCINHLKSCPTCYIHVAQSKPTGNEAKKTQPMNYFNYTTTFSSTLPSKVLALYKGSVFVFSLHLNHSINGSYIKHWFTTAFI